MSESEKVMKNFSLEDQEVIRSFIFTNPKGNISFIYPQQLIAGEELSPLMSAYSRTHIDMQTRVLQFLDKEKTEQTKAMLPYILPLTEIFRLPDGTLKVSKRTADFNTEFVLLHGHGSIKEETALFGYCEHLSDITIKKITGHPLNKPQVKSTRYLSYGKVLDLSLEDEDIALLPEADKYRTYIANMNRKYLELTERLTEFVFSHPDTLISAEFLKRPKNVEREVQKVLQKEKKKNKEFQATSERIEEERKKVLKSLEPEMVKKDVGKFVLDYSRVYLTAITRSSVGFSIDARTLEDVITELISSPRQEDQKTGEKLWSEVKKIAPVLLGEKSHVKIDDWKVQNEKEVRRYMVDKFSNILIKNNGTKKVNLIHSRKIETCSDRFNAGLAVFPYTDASLTDIVPALSENDVAEVLAKVHQYRGEQDVLHPSLSQGGLMHELVSAYHGYRDLFRHRKGARSTQLLTTRLGFEVPEMLKFFNLEQEYLLDMQTASLLYEQARKSSPTTAEKLVPFGANCRALHSWQLDETGYIGKLRSDIEKGNISYVETTREMIEEVRKIMPLTAQYFKVDTRKYPSYLWKKGYAWYDDKMKEE